MKDLFVIGTLLACILCIPADPLKRDLSRRETDEVSGTTAGSTVDFTKFQDAGKCFSTPTTYYGYYRSYLDDPVLADMCIAAKHIGVPENGTLTFDFVYERNGETIFRPSVHMYLCSTPDSDVQDCFRMPVLDVPGAEYVQYDFLYFKCGDCLLMWMPQYSEGSCVLGVTDLHNIDESCHQAYDYYCSPNKFFIHDEDMCPEVYSALQ
uniref:Savicalin n=1 Tax=Ornithodoros kalahariensis TaxID=1580572 RepID=D7PM86_ORNKA|nr:savicalin [Ornithodoros kalahariensis]